MNYYTQAIILGLLTVCSISFAMEHNQKLEDNSAGFYLENGTEHVLVAYTKGEGYKANTYVPAIVEEIGEPILPKKVGFIVWKPKWQKGTGLFGSLASHSHPALVLHAHDEQCPKLETPFEHIKEGKLSSTFYNAFIKSYVKMVLDEDQEIKYIYTIPTLAKLCEYFVQKYFDVSNIEYELPQHFHKEKQ